VAVPVKGPPSKRQTPKRSQPLPSVRLIAEHPFWSAFHYAFSGLLYAARTQRNMRIHLFAAALVLAATLALHLQRIYVIALIITIAVVLAFELVNTAIEAVVDLMTVAHHPLAKIAKDCAAGAVLVAAFGAVVVGYLAFYEGILAGGDRVYRAAFSLPSNAVFIAFVVVGIATIVAKTYAGHGTPLQGGAVSGHAALAFAAATFVGLLSHSALIAALGIFLAFLVAQSRVESGIHSIREVVFGALLGTGVAGIITLFIRDFPRVV
jgi:diacylglycerol kinase (ATP)